MYVVQRSIDAILHPVSVLGSALREVLAYQDIVEPQRRERGEGLW